MLREAGFRPGVVSRGYGGHAASYPLRVTSEVAASVCGDEPKLIAHALHYPTHDKLDLQQLHPGMV